MGRLSTLPFQPRTEGKGKARKKKKKKKETGKIQGLDYVSLQVLRVKRYSPPIIK